MRAALLMAGVLALSACGESPQIANRTRQDSAAFQGNGAATNAYAAPGWKQGDKTSWEQQLKTRAQQGQNDYVKVN